MCDGTLKKYFKLMPEPISAQEMDGRFYLRNKSFALSNNRDQYNYKSCWKSAFFSQDSIL